MTITMKKPAMQRSSGERVAALVSSAQAGEQRGWDALVREFGGMVWAVARAHRLQDHDAADVAQTTWLRLFEHLDRVNEPTRVGVWLATTARHECLRVLREAGRQVPVGDDAPQQVCPASLPHEELLLADRDRALWCSFSRLRTSDQALLRLLIAEPRLTYEEISVALAMPVGSIGPTRARVLERLREALDSEDALGSLRD